MSRARGRRAFVVQLAHEVAHIGMRFAREACAPPVVEHAPQVEDEAVVRVGEMLFLPAGWFHNVTSFSETSDAELVTASAAASASLLCVCPYHGAHLNDGCLSSCWMLGLWCREEFALHRELWCESLKWAAQR